jgi:hypothetical protein
MFVDENQYVNEGALVIFWPEDTIISMDPVKQTGDNVYRFNLPLIVYFKALHHHVRYQGDMVFDESVLMYPHEILAKLKQEDTTKEITLHDRRDRDYTVHFTRNPRQQNDIARMTYSLGVFHDLNPTSSDRSQLRNVYGRGRYRMYSMDPSPSASYDRIMLENMQHMYTVYASSRLPDLILEMEALLLSFHEEIRLEQRNAIDKATRKMRKRDRKRRLARLHDKMHMEQTRVKGSIPKYAGNKADNV